MNLLNILSDETFSQKMTEHTKELEKINNALKNNPVTVSAEEMSTLAANGESSITVVSETTFIDQLNKEIELLQQISVSVAESINTIQQNIDDLSYLVGGPTA